MSKEEEAEIDRISIIAAMLYQSEVADVKELIVSYILGGGAHKERLLTQKAWLCDCDSRIFDACVSFDGLKGNLLSAPYKSKQYVSFVNFIFDELSKTFDIPT